MDYDVHELTKSDGVKSDRILLAIARITGGPGGDITERTVFDVSAGANFYGPGGLRWGEERERAGEDGGEKAGREEGERKVRKKQRC